MRPSRGFTLVELLVALVILSSIAILSWRAIDGMGRTQDITQARADSDGKLRIVVSARDPGIANWMDTAGHPSGIIQGRWTGCDSQPIPEVRKVKVADVARLLPQAEVSSLNIDDYELPIYSEQREAELGAPAKVTAFLQQIAEADGIIVSFAEHNGTFTAAFKNLYDWASRSQRHIFQHKPALFLAAAPGPGGAKSVLDAAVKAAPYMGARLAGTVSVANFHQVFDPQVQLVKDSAVFIQLQQAALKLQQHIQQQAA